MKDKLGEEHWWMSNITDKVLAFDAKYMTLRNLAIAWGTITVVGIYLIIGTYNKPLKIVQNEICTWSHTLECEKENVQWTIDLYNKQNK